MEIFLEAKIYILNIKSQTLTGGGGQLICIIEMSLLESKSQGITPCMPLALRQQNLIAQQHPVAALPHRIYFIYLEFILWCWTIRCQNLVWLMKSGSLEHAGMST